MHYEEAINVLAHNTTQHNTTQHKFRFLLVFFLVQLFSLNTMLSGQDCPIPNCVTSLPGTNFKKIASSSSFSNLIGSVLSPTNDPNPQYIIVCANQQITCNTNYTFAPGSVIVFLEDARMVISSGSSLSLNGAQLRGCIKLWEGVTVEPNAGLRIENTTIQDATNGVILQQNSSIISSNCTFKNNYIGIQANGQLVAGGPTGPINANISGTTFDGSGNILETISIPSPFASSLGQPIPFNKPRTGIFVSKALSMTIGITNGAINTFRNFTPEAFPKFGIDCEDSNVTILRSRFLDSGLPNELDPVLAGGGVKFRTPTIPSATLKVTGLGSVEPTFSNSTYGCHVFSNCTIVDASFSNLFKGIWLDRSNILGYRAYKMVISKNIFENISENTVDALNIAPILSLEIRGNSFIDNNEEFIFAIYPRTAIYLSSVTPASQQALIIGNTFTNAAKGNPTPYWGIRIQNITSRVTIEKNDFYDYDSNGSGVSYNGLNIFKSRCNIWSNRFFGAGNFATHPSAAIKVFNSRCFINCNTMTNTTTGLEIEGELCDGSTISGNNFGHHQTGLLLKKFAKIGVQHNAQNQWLGSTSTVEAYFEGRNPMNSNDVDAIFVGYSIIRPHENLTTMPSNFWPNPRNVGSNPDNNWWFKDPTLAPFTVSCRQTIGIGLVEPGTEEITSSDAKKIDGTYISDSGYEAEITETDILLNAKMIQNEDLKPSGSPEEAWFNSFDNTTKRQLAVSYLTLTEDMTKIEESDRMYLDQKYLEIEEKTAEISLLNEQLEAAANDPVLLVALEGQSEIKNQELAVKNAEADAKLVEVAGMQVGKAQTLLTNLDAINPTDISEQDLKYMMEYLASTFIAGGNTSGKQSANKVEEIAKKCRHEGGLAVLMARASIRERLSWDEFDSCSKKPTTPNGVLVPKDGILYPNPANDQFSLQLEKVVVEASITLRDCLGKVCGEWQMNNQHTINCTIPVSLPQAMYFVEFKAANQGSKVYKLFIRS